MKRVRAACVFQTLVFFQKESSGLSREMQLKSNREEVEKYKAALARSHARHRIVEESEQEDGSVLVKVRKQYADHTDTGDYFDL